MFSITRIRVPGRQNAGPLNTFVPSIGTNINSKKPYRKGTVFITVSGLILISGTIMTVLGFTNVFGEGITMLGMLLIAVAVLLLFFAARQFLLAKKVRNRERALQLTRGTVAALAALVVDREDEMVGAFTVVMDSVNIDAQSRRSDEDCLPPDYTEATSDFYPESTEDAEDPPPPYGPPTYDETMLRKEQDEGEVTNEVLTNVDGDTGDEDDNCVSRVENQNVQEVSHTQQEPDAPVSPGYQDLPTVTI